MAPKTNAQPQAASAEPLGIITGQGCLRLERLLPGPAERVWAYLTESKKCAQWLAEVDSDFNIGSPIRLTFHHADLTPHEETAPDPYKECGGIQGTIRRCEPHKVLSYAWNWADQTSEVTFTLEPKGKEVLLRIDHRHIMQAEDMACIGTGWQTHSGILEAKLRGQTPYPFWAVFERLKPEYDHLVKGA